MFLRLKYFFKTNAATRRADSREYKTACKELYTLKSILDIKKDAITGCLNKDIIALCNKTKFIPCIRIGSFDTYYCPYFLPNAVCEGKKCASKTLNKKYIDALNKYDAQKKLVDEFWDNRMTERVNQK